MPRKRIGPEIRPAKARGGLAEKLAAELTSERESGQPLIYERVFRTGKASITVIWDAWVRIPLQERSATILRAYEMAEGPEAHDRVALANGLTVPEAHAAGMLPYQIIAAVRKNDSVTREQAQQAFLEEGASRLLDPQTPQLRFATEEEAEACRQRLLHRFPGTDDVWIILREITDQDAAYVQDWEQIEER